MQYVCYIPPLLWYPIHHAAWKKVFSFLQHIFKFLFSIYKGVTNFLAISYPHTFPQNLSWSSAILFSTNLGFPLTSTNKWNCESMRRCVSLPSRVEQFHSLVLVSGKTKMAGNKMARVLATWNDKFRGNCPGNWLPKSSWSPLEMLNKNLEMCCVKENTFFWAECWIKGN